MVYLVFLYVIELHLFINISALYNLLCSTFYKDDLLVYTLCLQISLDTYQALPAQLPARRSWRAGFQPQFFTSCSVISTSTAYIRCFSRRNIFI